METVLHDYVIIEPITDNSVLKSLNENINTGIVKSHGDSFQEFGVDIPITGIEVGDKVLFTQHLQIEEDGKKVYITRWRDIVKVTKNDVKA